ncbi:MAG TPA: SprT family zinc-dependent metalloprotease [Bacteroidales bacterium]|nr:SprT family zinc-dependent metalloprotease [Bacteroidales bacterium]
MNDTWNNSIQIGSKIIDFRIEYSNRKTLGITVTPEMNVLVKAPVNASIEKVKEKIKRKAPCIIKQQSFFHSFQPKIPQRKYVSGETYLYLGRQYRLKVTNYELGIINDYVKLSRGFLSVFTNDQNKTKQLVEEWYLQKAKERLPKIAEPLIEKFCIKYNLVFKVNNFSLRVMPQRWGSCTSKGKILINPELIKAPKGCIEYVIIHELCHLIHHDHTKKFLDLQTKEMKDWEKWKMKLEKLLA